MFNFLKARDRLSSILKKLFSRLEIFFWACQSLYLSTQFKRQLKIAQSKQYQHLENSSPTSHQLRLEWKDYIYAFNIQEGSTTPWGIKIAEIFFYLGNVALGTGNLTAAKKNYQYAIKANSKLGDAHFFLGAILAEENSLDLARSHLLKAAQLLQKQKQKLIWGTTPIINNKYWSQAMSQAGWDSTTFMTHHYPNNRIEDFDIYYANLVPDWMRSELIWQQFSPYFALRYILQNASIFHLSFRGEPLGSTRIWNLQAEIFKQAGIKTVVLSYGGDFQMYSKIWDPCIRHGLLFHYRSGCLEENETAQKVSYWEKHADIIVSRFMLDGAGRWDVLLTSALMIDVQTWQTKTHYAQTDGTNGVVKVLHTPNHRVIKGTEFLIQAVKDLQAEGLQVELILLENTPNDRVRELMQEADILAEQFIFTAYALSGIEGMASGLPVMANLEQEHYTRIFRRYAYLNECPIVSTTPETLKRNLRVLVTHPKLREELGRAGQLYAEKYHSYEAAQYIFGSIYDKILHGKDVDLMHLFHPLTSEYNRRKPIVQHPLIENQLPSNYFTEVR